MVAQESKRPYHKRKRALSEEETRLRITEAAVELHGTVGPAKTTITELAERAGVSRMTVYNHFSTDADLFIACSEHWAARNPFPDPSSWTGTADPEARLTKALCELYGWYTSNQGMLENVLRDARLVPEVGRVMDGIWGGYMDSVVAALAEGWPGEPQNNAALHVTLRVVIDFHTWRILTASGTSDDEAAELAACMVAGHAA